MVVTVLLIHKVATVRIKDNGEESNNSESVELAEIAPASENEPAISNTTNEDRNQMRPCSTSTLRTAGVIEVH